MIEYSRKIRDKGGVVIGNSAVFTRSIVNEKYVIFDSECDSGPALHLAPSVTALAAPPFRTDEEIYRDMLNKLSWGMLFLYYNERLNLDYPSLAARQFSDDVRGNTLGDGAWKRTYRYHELRSLRLGQ